MLFIREYGANRRAMMLGGDHRRELPNGRLGVNRPARHPKVRNRRIVLKKSVATQ